MTAPKSALSRLKNVFLIRDIVRIIDLHFASLERLQLSMQADRQALESSAGCVIRNQIAILDGLSRIVSALAEIKAQSAGELERARHSMAANDNSTLNALSEMSSTLAEIKARVLDDSRHSSENPPSPM
jgi:hypothetical protein